MNKGMYLTFIEKLIRETKTKKLKWQPSNFTDFHVDIPNLGNVRIDMQQESLNVNMYIGADDRGYLQVDVPFKDKNLFRLYSIVEDIYLKEHPESDLEQAITAYINS